MFKSVAHKDAVSGFNKIKPLIREKIGVFHYAPASVRKRKEEFEARDDVEKVYYDGPNRLFSVKLKTGAFVRRVLRAAQIKQPTVNENN